MFCVYFHCIAPHQHHISIQQALSRYKVITLLQLFTYPDQKSGWLHYHASGVYEDIISANVYCSTSWKIQNISACNAMFTHRLEMDAHCI